MAEPININCNWWPPEQNGEYLDDPVYARVAVERDASPNEIALHTYVNEQGSKASYYFDRECAIALAFEILKAVQLQ